MYFWLRSALNSADDPTRDVALRPGVGRLPAWWWPLIAGDTGPLDAMFPLLPAAGAPQFQSLLPAIPVCRAAAAIARARRTPLGDGHAANRSCAAAAAPRARPEEGAEQGRQQWVDASRAEAAAAPAAAAAGLAEVSGQHVLARGCDRVNAHGGHVEVPGQHVHARGCDRANAHSGLAEALGQQVLARGCDRVNARGGFGSVPGHPML